MEYSKEMCEKLKRHCENGKSLESFPAHIGVSPKLIESWYVEYPEFKETVEMSPCLELYYWEMELIRALSRADKESINIARIKLDRLTKLVVSPLKRTTYSGLKESKIQKENRSSTGDLVQDFNLLYGDKKQLKGKRN